MKNLTQNARSLRKNMTEQERILWQILKSKQFYGYKFLRQYVIGEYIVDFICREKRIIIEIDGGQHNTPTNIEYDNKRTLYLESLNFKVIRFWNNEITQNIDGVFQKLSTEFGIGE